MLVLEWKPMNEIVRKWYNLLVDYLTPMLVLEWRPKDKITLFKKGNFNNNKYLVINKNTVSFFYINDDLQFLNSQWFFFSSFPDERIG